MPHSITPSRWRDALAILGGVVARLGLLLVAGSGLGSFPGNADTYGGFTWTSGQAVGLFVAGLVAARVSAANASQPLSAAP